jgi:hypothetical protein
VTNNTYKLKIAEFQAKGNMATQIVYLIYCNSCWRVETFTRKECMFIGKHARFDRIAISSFTTIVVADCQGTIEARLRACIASSRPQPSRAAMEAQFDKLYHVAVKHVAELCRWCPNKISYRWT